jgi:hypothetical protein
MDEPSGRNGALWIPDHRRTVIRAGPSWHGRVTCCKWAFLGQCGDSLKSGLILADTMAENDGALIG